MRATDVAAAAAVGASPPLGSHRLQFVTNLHVYHARPTTLRRLRSHRPPPPLLPPINYLNKCLGPLSVAHTCARRYLVCGSIENRMIIITAHYHLAPDAVAMKRVRATDITHARRPCVRRVLVQCA